MKKSFLIFAFFLIAILQSISGNLGGEVIRFYKSHAYLIGIKDGWYSSTVKYSNYTSGTYKTYTLDVKVELNRVVIIDFGNGGSVHSGYNEYGYIYTGGYLYFERNLNGNIIAATTSVSVSDSNGLRDFKIRID